MKKFHALFFFCVGVCVALQGAQVTDGAGRVVEFAAAPKRIVSMAPSTTELICAVGAQEELVGITRHCVYPESIRDRQVVGSSLDPDYERIVALKPDVVIMSHLADKRAIGRFERLGIAVMMLNPEGLDSVGADLRLLGKALGREKQAEAAAVHLEQSIAARKAQVARYEQTHKRPRVLFLYGTKWNLSAGKGSFAGDLLNVAGGQNLADEAKVPWPQLSKEYVLARDPQIILLVEEGGEGKIFEPQVDNAQIEQWKKDPVYSRLEAVKKNRVYKLDARLFYYPGPRLVDALDQLAGIIDAYFCSLDSGKTSEAATDNPNKSATMPSDSSMSM